jgi:chromate transporter
VLTTESRPGRATLGAIALSFLKLGTLAFGGPAVHIAMMEEEFVRRRRWLTPQEFLDRLGAANLIPGPSSTEMAIYIGQNQRGWLGLIVAGCSFILPAAILVSAIAAAYVRFGALPQVAGVLYALKPVVIAVVLQALWKLARSAVKTRLLGAIGILAAVAFAFGIYDLLVLGGAGLCAAGPAIWERLRKTQGSSAITLFALKLKSPVISLAAISGLAAAPFSLGRLFLTFLKIGSVLFGSGYVLLAFLRSDFVLRLRWLTERQLLDAVAVGQITPGPVFTTATFIGYLLGGTRGAIVATVGIFLPGFLFVAASGALLPRIRRSAIAGAALDGIIAGSLALMAVVTWQLGRGALVDPLTIAIACVSAVLLFAFGLNAAWLILGAALVGVLRGA